MLAEDGSGVFVLNGYPDAIGCNLSGCVQVGVLSKHRLSLPRLVQSGGVEMRLRCLRLHTSGVSLNVQPRYPGLIDLAMV